MHRLLLEYNNVQYDARTQSVAEETNVNERREKERNRYTVPGFFLLRLRSSENNSISSSTYHHTLTNLIWVEMVEREVSADSVSSSSSSSDRITIPFRCWQLPSLVILVSSVKCENATSGNFHPIRVESKQSVPPHRLPFFPRTLFSCLVYHRIPAEVYNSRCQVSIAICCEQMEFGSAIWQVVCSSACVRRQRNSITSRRQLLLILSKLVLQSS